MERTTLAVLPGHFFDTCARLSLIVLLALSLALVRPAAAQRTQDNAITQAGDAFGTVVGNQTIGLYTPTNARGFSPTEASNVRIEGLYFDQQAAFDPYLFSGSDIRVGISAQTYAFPSPSGIADLKLRMPADGNGASVVLNRGPLEQFSTEVDARYQPIESWKGSLNVAVVRNFDCFYARSSDRRAISLVSRFTPYSGAEFIPFLGYVHSKERELAPIVYSDRVHPLPLFDGIRLPTQSWTTSAWSQITAGLLAKSVITGPWSFSAGVFRSVEKDAAISFDLFLGLQPDGSAEHVVNLSPERSFSSYSGDVRITRSWSEAVREGELTFALRGRDVVHFYGGDSTIDLGKSSIFQSVRVPRPIPMFSEQSRDAVRQVGIGISYSERWKDRASFGLGILATGYQRKLDIPGVPSVGERKTVTLPTASFTADLSRATTIYGSYTRGLEDAMIAPTSAQNRGEPPPATPTWQVDGGVRIMLRPHLQLLAGAFKVHKSYFSLDTAGRYLQLGDISSRGVETSVTWIGPQGLTIVAGACWLQPEVKRRIAEQGGNGGVPVGPVPRTINVNVDYAPSSWRGWGTTFQWTSLSSRTETSDDSYMLPPLATLSVGIRYLFKFQNRSFSARITADNATNATGLTISTAYSVVSQPGRNYTFTFAADL